MWITYPLATMNVTAERVLQTSTVNSSSVRNDCIKVIFSEMEFLPWDNPDNIVSERVETIVRRIKDNLLVFLFLIGGPANSINMVVFYKQGLRDRVNLCLFALSLADEIHLWTLLLMNAEQLYLQFTTKERFGPIFTFVTNNHVAVFVASASISTLLSAIIATERCLCVYSPLRFRSLLQTRTMAVIIIVVSTVTTGLAFLVLFRYRIGCVYDPVSGVVMRTAIEGTFYKAHKELINHVHSFLFGVGLAALEMVVVTTTTVMTIVKLRLIATWRSGASSGISAKELALTKVLVANSILFMICVTPVSLIRLSRVFLPEINSGRRGHNFFLVSIWLTDTFLTINSTFNFFIYYIMGSRYRETFWSLFGRKVKATKVGAGEH